MTEKNLRLAGSVFVHFKLNTSFELDGGTTSLERLGEHSKNLTFLLTFSAVALGAVILNIAAIFVELPKANRLQFTCFLVNLSLLNILISMFLVLESFDVVSETVLNSVLLFSNVAAALSLLFLSVCLFVVRRCSADCDSNILHFRAMFFLAFANVLAPIFCLFSQGFFGIFVATCALLIVTIFLSQKASFRAANETSREFLVRNFAEAVCCLATIRLSLQLVKLALLLLCSYTNLSMLCSKAANLFAFDLAASLFDALVALFYVRMYRRWLANRVRRLLLLAELTEVQVL